MTIAEPDVTLTDYGLALECALLAFLLHRTQNPGRLRKWFVVFFSALSLASLTGGTTHGFLHDQSTIAHAVMWDGTLIAIGIAALSAWMIGARIVPGEKLRVWAPRLALALFAIYCAVVLLVRNSFLVAMIHYLPAVVFLLVALLWRYLRNGDRHVLAGLAGLLLTFVAAVIQQAGVGIHPSAFNHNALYHLIQAVAFLLLFQSARGLIQEADLVLT